MAPINLRKDRAEASTSRAPLLPSRKKVLSDRQKKAARKLKAELDGYWAKAQVSHPQGPMTPYCRNMGMVTGGCPVSNMSDTPFRHTRAVVPGYLKGEAKMYASLELAYQEEKLMDYMRSGEMHESQALAQAEVLRKLGSAYEQKRFTMWIPKQWQDDVWKGEGRAIHRMLGLMREKYRQHAPALRALLATGDTYLLEATPDLYWGCGVHKDAIFKTKLAGPDFPGENWHGILSMRIRAEARGWTLPQEDPASLLRHRTITLKTIPYTRPAGAPPIVVKPPWKKRKRAVSTPTAAQLPPPPKLVHLETPLLSPSSREVTPEYVHCKTPEYVHYETDSDSGSSPEVLSAHVNGKTQEAMRGLATIKQEAKTARVAKKPAVTPFWGKEWAGKPPAFGLPFLPPSGHPILAANFPHHPIAGPPRGHPNYRGGPSSSYYQGYFDNRCVTYPIRKL